MDNYEKILKFLILTICLTFGTGAEDVNLKTLRQVQVLYRHGDRSPIHSYPKDPYNAHYRTHWPEGLGQLTAKGKDQHYDLGQFLRQRYDGFIDREYDTGEIYVLSSDTDRCLMSAEAHLAGFYPRTTILRSTGGGTNNNRSYSSKLDIQLVPIHIVPKQVDKILKMTASCPRKHKAWADFMSTSEEYKKATSDNKEFLDFVSQNAGMTITSLSALKNVHDPLFCQQQHGLQLPAWVNQTVMDRMAKLRGIYFNASHGGSTELKRLKGGPLAKKILANMREFETEGNESYKLHMFSAHDDTVAAVMSTMDVFNAQLPPYASVFIIELHEDEGTGRRFVELFYRNSTDQPPHELHVPGCGSPCYVDDLSEALSTVLPKKWERDCETDPTEVLSSLLSSSGGGESPVSTSSAYTAITAIIGLLAAAIIVCLSILVIRSRWKQRNMFSERKPILQQSSCSQKA